MAVPFNDDTHIKVADSGAPRFLTSITAANFTSKLSEASSAPNSQKNWALDGDVSVAVPTTIPKNVTVTSMGGKFVKTATNATLTIHGKILTPRIPLFSGFTRDNLSIKADVECYFPEWFGAAGDGTTDDWAALQMMFDCILHDSVSVSEQGYPGGNLIKFGGKKYYSSKLLHVTKCSIIEGVGGGMRTGTTQLNFGEKTSGIAFHHFDTRGEHYGVSGVGATITSTNSNFSAKDVNRFITLYGATGLLMTNGSPNYQITGVTNGTTITVSPTPASFTGGALYFKDSVGDYNNARGSVIRDVVIRGSGTNTPTHNITTQSDGTFTVNSLSGIGKPLTGTGGWRAEDRGYPAGTTMACGPLGYSTWVLDYQGDYASRTPRMHGRVLVSIVNGVATANKNTFESWMIGTIVRIDDKCYTIRAINSPLACTLSFAAPFTGGEEPVDGGLIGTQAIFNYYGDMEYLQAPTGKTIDVRMNVSHGILIYAPITIERVTVHDFHGDGFHFDSNMLSANLGGTPDCNYSKLTTGWMENNSGHGLFARGINSNVITVNNCNAFFNQGWGYWDESFLGNTYIANHANGNSLGGYTTRGGVNQTTMYGNYAEGGQPSNILTANTTFIGGLPGNGFAGRDNKGPRVIGTVNEQELFASSAVRVTNGTPNITYRTDRYKAIFAQLGTSDRDYPHLMSFGAVGDGTNPLVYAGGSAAGQKNITPDVKNWVFSYGDGTEAGWYRFRRTELNAEPTLLFAGTGTVRSTDVGKVWAKRGIAFGSASFSANGRTEPAPLWNLEADTKGLLLQANMKANSFQPEVDADTEAASAANRGKIRVVGSGGDKHAEQITFTTQVTGYGDIHVIVKSDKFADQLVFFFVNEASAGSNNSTASEQATEARAALNANATITEHYTIGGTGATVLLTAKVAGVDNTFNIEAKRGNASQSPGFTPIPTSTVVTTGTAGSAVDDRVQVCVALAAGGYAWKTVTLT